MHSAVILEPHDVDKLIKSITDTVRDEFNKIRTNNPDKPMSRKEAAKFLGINPKTLDNRFNAGLYPIKLMHGKGRSKHFFASELEAFLKKS